MLDLSNVTLVFVETRAHEITHRVIEDCLTKAKFGDILIYTDNAALVDIPGARYVSVPDWPNKKLAGQFYYSEAALGVETDFGLFLEWDAGIFNPDRWLPQFFDYDYIGAPWITRDIWKVGNGGFTLMSKRFSHFLCNNRDRYPVYTDWDVCRTQRIALEEAGGFKWPDANLASHFAWELGPRNPKNFGYHAVFTWPEMLPREEVVLRAKLMLKTPYLLSKMAPLVKAAPWLKEELGEEGWAQFAEANAGTEAVRRASYLGYRRGPPPADIQRMLMQRQMVYQSLQRKGLKA